MRTLHTTLLASTLLFLAACGGGGSGGAADLAVPDFQGEWHALQLQGTGSVFGAFWGTAVADAAGSLTLNLDQNLNGALDTGLTATGTWQVTADGTLRTEGYEGGITPAGDVAVLAAETSGTPGIIVLLRKAGAFANASVNGEHHVIQMRRRLDLSAMQSGHYRVAYDGVSSFADAGPSVRNLNGVVGNFTFGGGSYAIAPDGTYATINSAGGVLLGGDALIVGGRTTADDPLGVVALPVSVAATPARFLGTYAVVGLQYDFVANEYRSTRATLVANGAGGGSATGYRNIEGSYGPLLHPDVSYTIDPDGTLYVTWADGDTLRGGLSPDGRLAVLAGGTKNGMKPACFVLVRIR